MIAIVPHSTYHNIRTPLLKVLRRVDDIIVLYEKDILEEEDYPILERRAYEVASELRKKGVGRVAIVLTGSYLACILTYEAFRDFKPILLQWDSRRRTYIVFEEE